MNPPGRPKGESRSAKHEGFRINVSASRLWAVMRKEFTQLRRDRLTFAMMIGVPLLQLTLFGYAINGDPRRLPTVLVAQEQTVITRSLVHALENSGYFRIVASSDDPRVADAALADGSAQFALTVPAGFARALQRGERAQDRKSVV